MQRATRRFVIRGGISDPRRLCGIDYAVEDSRLCGLNDPQSTNDRVLYFCDGAFRGDDQAGRRGVRWRPIC